MRLGPQSQILRILLRHSSGAGAAPSPSFAKRTATKSRTLIYCGIFGLGSGATLGGYHAWKDWKSRQSSLIHPTGIPNYLDENSTSNLILKENERPNHRISRFIKFPFDPAITGLSLTLYQYQTCPFCCKVRALLDYLGISYKIVEVNPVLRTELKWSENYKKVPILIVDFETTNSEGQRQTKTLKLTDSSMIVSLIYSYWLGQTSTNGKKNALESPSSIEEIAKFYPSLKYTDDKGQTQSDIMNKYFLMYEAEAGETDGRSKKEIQEERKWREWADSVYVHTLSPNIYRTVPEALDSFRYFDKVGEWEKNFSAWERSLVIYVGALAMWMVGKRLQSRHHLHKDVRQSLYEESEHFVRGIKKKGCGDFIGGSKPNLADLAVYGVLSSIEGCAAFRDLEQNSSIVKDWYRKVQASLSQPLSQPQVAEE